MRESPSPVSQPVVYHHGDLPNALLDAIAEIVEEKDSADVSLREVARRAGVSHSAPAHHFGDKEGMLAAFCDRGYEILRSEMQEARDGAATGDALDRIGAVGAAYVRFAVDHRPYFEVMFHSGIEKEAYGDLYTCAKNALGVLMEVVAEFVNERELGDVDLRIVAVYFWSLAHGLASLAVEGSMPPELQDLSVDDYVAGVFGMSARILGPA
ncbi:MAG: TetR/AcrR family transcriptional regulator [Acidimicrobiia bacterium]|jgi:AcrR family transcriptional regulator